VLRCVGSVESTGNTSRATKSTAKSVKRVSNTAKFDGSNEDIASDAYSDEDDDQVSEWEAAASEDEDDADGNEGSASTSKPVVTGETTQGDKAKRLRKPNARYDGAWWQEH